MTYILFIFKMTETGKALKRIEKFGQLRIKADFFNFEYRYIFDLSFV